MEKKYAYLIKNTIILTIGSIGTRLISFFLAPLYTSVLSTTQYGIVDLIDVTSLLIYYVISLDISDVVARFALDKYNKKGVFKFGCSFLFKTSIGAAALIFIFSYFDIFHWEKHFYIYLFVQYIFLGMNLIAIQFLKGIDKLVYITISGIISTIVRIILIIILLVIADTDIDGYIIANISGTFVSILICFKGIFSSSLDNAINDKKQFHEMIRYAFPMAINALGWWVAQGIDKYFVSYFKGYDDNGVYAISYKIPSIIFLICEIFNQAFAISAVKELEDDVDQTFFKNTFDSLHTILSVSCSILIIFNTFITRILFAQDYFRSWQYSSWLIISAMFTGLSGYFGGICDAKKKVNILAFSTLTSAIANIVFNIILIPVWGCEGAAIATMTSVFIIYFIRHMYVKNTLGMKYKIITEFLVYFLLIIQVIFDHFENHSYVIQVVILLFIVILRWDVLIEIFQNIKLKIFKR